MCDGLLERVLLQERHSVGSSDMEDLHQGLQLRFLVLLAGCFLALAGCVIVIVIVIVYLFVVILVVILWVATGIGVISLSLASLCVLLRLLRLCSLLMLLMVVLVVRSGELLTRLRKQWQQHGIR